jgi:hypothetical protein
MCIFKKKIPSLITLKVEPMPSKAVQVTGDQVFNVLMTVVPQAAHVYLSDETYWLCSKEDIETFLKFDDTNKHTYVAEQHDCDDFSYRLMGQLSDDTWSGIAFGILWTDAHAMNIIVTDDLKVYFIEPQSDAVEITMESWQGTEILLVVL